MDMNEFDARNRFLWGHLPADKTCIAPDCDDLAAEDSEYCRECTRQRWRARYG